MTQPVAPADAAAEAPRPQGRPRRLRVIAVLQMVGALFGAIGLLALRDQGGAPAERTMSGGLVLLAQILFAFSFYAGLRLWRNPAVGVPLSKLVQWLQVPYLDMGSASYSFYTGVQAVLAFAWPMLEMEFGLGGEAALAIRWGTAAVVETPAVGVNVASLVILWLLARGSGGERASNIVAPAA